ncbi:hypothetical protein O9993_17380 [Vibrio lentus]|nr:hypothetical protein [Vibrio lentus]
MERNHSPIIIRLNYRHTANLHDTWIFPPTARKMELGVLLVATPATGRNCCYGGAKRIIMANHQAKPTWRSSNNLFASLMSISIVVWIHQ